MMLSVLSCQCGDYFHVIDYLSTALRSALDLVGYAGGLRLASRLFLTAYFIDGSRKQEALTVSSNPMW